jgi:hypothetical protein
MSPQPGRDDQGEQDGAPRDAEADADRPPADDVPDERAPILRTDISQSVEVTGGYSATVAVGNIVIFGDRVPVFRLEDWRPPAEPETSFLRAVASRMLNARYAVVDFTGRSQDLSQLRAWRDSSPRLAVRWLHGEGGQGKSRLAAKLAAESAAAGWRVLTVLQGPNSILPPGESLDLRLDGRTGVLLLVDYANEWPSSHLSWLLSDAVFHQVGVPARVLLLARSHGDWQGLRSRLEEHRADFSVQRLGPLPHSAGPGPRQEMFAAARAAFGARYGLQGTHALEPPSDLSGPEFGLTLAVHMAALVAVDAAARNAPPPRGAGMSDLTRYLLDREYKHWEQQYGDPEHELNPENRSFFTPAPVMNRVVFTAALTGPVSRAAGRAVLEKQMLPLGAPQLLADHAVCYPPADPDHGDALEPLYPDRLTEDFLALTLPGHGIDHPEQEWAAKATVDVLLPLAGHHSGGDAEPAGSDSREGPPWTARSLVFLAAAAMRWRHVGTTVLYPWAVLQPRRFLAGGSAALSALAAIDRERGPALEPELFAALGSVHRVLPPGGDTDLDSGMADVTERLAGHVLAGRTSHAARVEWLCDCGLRLGRAGRHDLAAARFAAAEPTSRRLAGRGRPDHEANLAFVLCHLGTERSQLGDNAAAVEPLEESVLRYRRLAAAAPADHLADLALATINLSQLLQKTGRTEDALAAVDEAISSLRMLPGEAGAAHRPRLAGALGNRSIIEYELGHPAAALTAANQAVALLRELAAQNPAEHLPALALALNGLGNGLSRVGRFRDAIEPTREAEAILRTLAKANPAAYRHAWATTVGNLGLHLANRGDRGEARDRFEEAVAAGRLLAATNPVAYLPDLARHLVNLGNCLKELGRPEQAHTALSEGTGTYRVLADALPDVHLSHLAGALSNLGALEMDMHRPRQATETLRQSVDIVRRLSAQNPARHRQLLVLALHNLSDALMVLGRADEAEAVAREAIAREADPRDIDADVHLPGSAMALLSLADTLAAQDRDGEAANASGRAVEILRDLARDNPNHVPGFAVALHNHGIHLASADEPTRALGALRESVALLRLLAAANPAAYAEQLGVGLYVLGCVLADGEERQTEAICVFEDAAEAFARAAELRTTTAPLRCAAKLNEICDMLFELGPLPRALALAEDSAARFRRLDAAEPDRYRAALGLALSRLCRRIYNDGRMADSKAVGQEALSILRGLTAAQRAEDEDGETLREAEHSIEALGAFDNPWARQHVAE